MGYGQYNENEPQHTAGPGQLNGLSIGVLSIGNSARVTL
jgi:hypothetical protein